MEKFNSSRWLWAPCAGVMLAIGAFVFTGCAGTHSTSGETYDYTYYPQADIYYYPATRVYYWNSHGQWQSGRQLPSEYNVHESRREYLHLHTLQPWTEPHASSLTNTY